MQIKYRSGTNISGYHRNINRGGCVFPNEEGYVSNGYYGRQAMDENSILIDFLKIKRFKKKDNTATKSFLPEQLAPYNKYPIETMAQVLKLWRCGRYSIYEAINMICGIYGKKSEDTAQELYNLSGAQLYKFMNIFEQARVKYVIWKKVSRTYPLEKFIELCSNNDYEYIYTVSESYGKENAGRFLFGTPSQLRYKPH